MRTTAPIDEGELDRQWWKEAIVYQIYPRSFNDSDGDGVGDIQGIVEKVDYLDSLGIDVVWLCPVYDSPNADNGYDIADYRSVHPEFGTIDDWEILLEELHAQDMRLIMDLVINHTSDEHEWFERSRQCEGRYEDYYHWRDGSPDEPPNNWTSVFGGPAWTYDDERREWYLHLFDKKQPDLNWRNRDVRADITEMITWWLEKGIDGFRMDAIDFLSKAEGLPDGDPSSSLVGSEHYIQGPQIHEHLRELYNATFSNYDVMLVGEMGQTNIEEVAAHLGEDGDGLDMVFQFDHMGVDAGSSGQWDLDEWGEWDLREFKQIITRAQNELEDGGWNALFMGNHDLPRIVSRFGDDADYRAESAKLVATFLLTMRGTPYVYQGQEIGMTNADFRTLEEVDDTMTVGKVDEFLAAGVVDSYEEVRDLVNYWSRDHSRTPMQWSGAEHAGFTTGNPWLAVNANHSEINVESALDDESSVWHHYQDLIDLRDDRDALVYGEYDLLIPDDEQLYAYTRTLDDETWLVVLNWSDRPKAFDGSIETDDMEAVIGNYDDAQADPACTEFRPYEAVVYRIGVGS
ncbi:glycoside hydrolase family 13 protein [Halalkalicoccus subterraneus]|uniref:glycoside hydrolase family 13 protein n=1 Tax=Halalkalicoccus subterraneus TaxID=2675002 RepID=UPI000EFDA898|nr:alpha-glucosidase [Halalkalicoccus subterraneus]